ncbi:galactose oxidase [Mucilaginibacter sp. PAMB04168]|uniref:galactose oxidase n=1 Tax=Mucilaginibacter sp. PAMB04168 TaxID=3138567 RepID=UPI0031F69B81
MYRAIFYRIFGALFFISSATNAFGQSDGLTFASHEVVQEKRTFVDLGSEKGLNFSKSFELEFEISFLPNRETYFGYILRVIEGDTQNVDLVYNAEMPNNHFNVITGEKLSSIIFDIEKRKLFNSWNKIRIRFDFEKRQILLHDGSKWYVEKRLPFKKASTYKVLLGGSLFKQFQTTDVPPMKIRNVKIFEAGALKYNWRLNEEKGSIVHEDMSQNNGRVENPLWAAALHRNWRAVQSFTVQGMASTAFNPQKETLYIVGSDSLYSLSVSDEKWINTNYSTGPITLNMGNYSICNPSSNSLYNFYKDQRFISSYDFTSRKWTKESPKAPSTNSWHVNKSLSASDSSLYLFAGYGHLLYKNEVQKYRFGSQKWEDVKTRGDFFTPRYLSALGANRSGDTIYILGGFGNSSGKQILNPKNMYDLMRFTVKDHTFKKLYDLKANAEDFAFANSLVINNNQKSYYALTFPAHKYQSKLQLIKGSLTSPNYKLVGDPIPYTFHDTHSYADLYYCPSTKKFVAVTLLRLNANQTRVNVFTLLGPPYAINNNANVKNTKRNYWLVGGILLISVIGGCSYFFMNKRKETSDLPSISKVSSPPVVDREVIPVPETPDVTVISPETRLSSQGMHHKSVVFLFGDLQVFDKDGNNISKSFTPLIKELFLVILLYSLRWGRGLSSDKLNEILWYDKSVKSARNNRSVNMAKLKVLLDKIGHCQLSKETGGWIIDYDMNQTYVDYGNYLQIIKDKKELTVEKIKLLSDITRRGNFLSNIEYEWLDPFKSEISNEVIDCYLQFLHAPNRNYEPELMIEIANYIFYFDPVNEEAMIIKCRALSALGKHSLALNTFENFTKEYKNIYGEVFKKDFHAVTSDI